MGLLKGREREKIFKISRDFSRIFSLFSLYFSFSFFSLSFSSYFSQKNKGVLIGEPRKGEAMCSVPWYTTQPPTFATALGYFVFFLVSGPNFVQLFGGLSELHFLQNIYFQKYLDVQFLLVLTLKDLELWLSRYRFWKEGYAMLKIL